MHSFITIWTPQTSRCQVVPPPGTRVYSLPRSGQAHTGSGGLVSGAQHLCPSLVLIASFRETHICLGLSDVTEGLTEVSGHWGNVKRLSLHRDLQGTPSALHPAHGSLASSPSKGRSQWVVQPAENRSSVTLLLPNQNLRFSPSGLHGEIYLNAC